MAPSNTLNCSLPSNLCHFLFSSFISGPTAAAAAAAAPSAADQYVDTLRWATVAIPSPTRHCGWSTLEQDWKPTGRLTYYTIAWPNGRAVCKEHTHTNKKKGKKKMMFSIRSFLLSLGGDRCVRQRCQIADPVGENAQFFPFFFRIERLFLPLCNGNTQQ